MVFGVTLVRFLLAALACALLLAGLSFLINELWLGAEHELYPFFRSDDDLRVTPGLGVTTFVWSLAVTAGYPWLGVRLNRLRLLRALSRATLTISSSSSSSSSLAARCSTTCSRLPSAAGCSP